MFGDVITRGHFQLRTKHVVLEITKREQLKQNKTQTFHIIYFNLDQKNLTTEQHCRKRTSYLAVGM